jgi:hypothetical protein
MGRVPIAVDGAKTPRNIPDELAYRHFMMAVAVPLQASAKQMARRDALLATVGLSKRDHSAVVRSMRTVREGLDQVVHTRRQIPQNAQVSVSTQVSLSALRGQENQIFKNARTRLRDSLSWEGGMRLDKHVQDRVKRRIVVYGDLSPVN